MADVLSEGGPSPACLAEHVWAETIYIRDNLQKITDVK
jgi:hypothetical protein